MGTLSVERHWVILLAGGEGSRLHHFTRTPQGVVVPKQFCRFRKRETLLALAVRRALALSAGERIVPVVMERHRLWWEPELKCVPRSNLVRQRQNLGTAVAILLALVEVLARDPGATVTILPSDHEVDDEVALEGAIRDAIAAAREWPDHLVLVGMRPEVADPSYGWILPSAAGRAGTLGVVSFVEKPDPGEAERLLSRGALVNSFIVTTSAMALLDIYRLCVPEVLLALEDPGPADPYLAVPVRDFGHDLLERAVRRLRVLPAPPCGWTDLGTPGRLQKWLHEHDESFDWDRWAASQAEAS